MNALREPRMQSPHSRKCWSKFAALSHTTIQAFSDALKDILHTACHPIPEQRYSSVKELREELANFSDNRVLYKIIDRADDHFSALRGLISQDVSVEDEKVRRQKVHNHRIQARFGYEQAARSTDLELQFIAEERTIALAKAMCEFLFEEGKLSTARWVIDLLECGLH